MELTRSLIEEKAEEYKTAEPLYAVEAEEIETFSSAVATGNFGWRDAEWVVQWYYRRYLGAYPDARRRAAEDAYGENDFEAVRDALESACTAANPTDALEHLTGLSGVDVPVGSAFLMFLDPESAIVVGDREWSVLHATNELADPIPDPITMPDYAGYLEACRAVADRCACSMWMLYRALWRLWADRFG